MAIIDSADCDLIFYTNPMSRGRIVRWMLEEVGVDYRQVLLALPIAGGCSSPPACTGSGKGFGGPSYPPVIECGHLVSKECQRPVLVGWDALSLLC